LALPERAPGARSQTQLTVSGDHNMNVKLVDNMSIKLVDELLRVIAKSNDFRTAVAFVSTGGFSLLEPVLRECLKRNSQ
jgi:HKD family nuclease